MDQELILPKREQLQDDQGRALTQSLFLEVGYSDFAVYTLKDRHYEYKGKLYPSLKILFIEMNDPTEYRFAEKYLLGWSHWQRMCENKMLNKHFDEWRIELEMKLRSQAVSEMILSAKGGNYSAAKWIADRGWAVRGAGRPTKDEVEGERKRMASIMEDYSNDVVRLQSVK